MLQVQPFFIGGIEDPDEARNSAFGAMAMFIVTFSASLAGIWYDSNHKPEKTTGGAGAGAEGDDEPEAEYQLAQDNVPSYGT